MLRRSALGIAAAMIGCVRADAAEFGNLFGGASAQSRAASAQALEALSKIFIALRDRELRRINPGEAGLFEAAQALYRAADQMSAIEIPDSQNKELTDPLVSALLSAQLSGPPPSDLRQLFKLFIGRTQQLADLLGRLSKEPASVPVLPQLEPTLTRYIELGSLVTIAARPVSH